MRSAVLLVILAILAVIVHAVSSQDLGDPHDVPKSTDAASAGIIVNNDCWQAKVYGEDWAHAASCAGEVFPELRKESGVPATDADSEFCRKLPDEEKEKLNAAVAAYYERMAQITPAYAGRRFTISAVRESSDFCLLWIEEPEVCDGGRSLIYSRKSKTIVGDFWDGGIRG